MREEFKKIIEEYIHFVCKQDDNKLPTWEGFIIWITSNNK